MTRFTNRIVRTSVAFTLAAIAAAPLYADNQGSKPSQPDKVQVVNTPNVKVVNTPHVKVINTPKVLNANDFNVFQEVRRITSAVGAEALVFEVPDDKRLVIEFASIRAVVGRDETIDVVITGGNGFTDVRRPIVTTFQHRVAGDDIYVGSQLMRMYAEPGSAVRFVVLRRDAADQGIIVSDAVYEANISGYLVDPQ